MNAADLQRVSTPAQGIAAPIIIANVTSASRIIILDMGLPDFMVLYWAVK